MKLNRFVALALIAVIAVATMSFFSIRALAQTPDPATPAQDCANENDDADESEGDGEDLDNVEEECGPQDEAGGEANEAEEAEDAAEGPDVAITGTELDQASAAALAYVGEGQVTGTEMGDEEGYYEIEVTLDNGSQVDVHLDENFNVLGQLEDNE
jgi:hypothetical protein